MFRDKPPLNFLTAQFTCGSSTWDERDLGHWLQGTERQSKAGHTPEIMSVFPVRQMMCTLSVTLKANIQQRCMACHHFHAPEPCQRLNKRSFILDGRSYAVSIFPSSPSHHPQCQLQVGTCHLPLEGLNHVLLQLLTFHSPWKEFRVEKRKEVLCAQGKTGRTGLQIDIFQSQFFFFFFFLLVGG